MGTQADILNVEPASLDARVLVVAATTKDAALTRGLLSTAGMQVEICASIEALAGQVRVGAAAVLIAEEALSPQGTTTLARVLADQPPWSDLPLLILARQGSDSMELGDAVRVLGNVTLLERPLRMATVLSVVRTAMRARLRQYEIRRHLEDRKLTEDLLRRADQRKDEFLATLGHELRNPLAPLMIAVQLLKEMDPPDRTVLSLMERQLRHLARLVDDLLEVSRITRGLIEVRREPVDLGAVVHASIETVRPAIEAAGHELTIELPPEPTCVIGDAVRLTQVFANLLGNASKYTDAGGRIALRVRRASGLVEISVRDTGIGIHPEHLTSVFDMFTQVDRSSRRSQGGLGIGLTLVRSLVAMHGGTVVARSEGSGKGSEFVVELPVATETTRTVAGRRDIGRLPPRRILVVDDNEDAARTLAMLLGRLGATVSVTHSGPEALEVLGAFRPDAVLLDIGMPGMDGYEVARRLRASAEHRGMLLIALTGWGQQHDLHRAVAAGFDHHMLKPPDLQVLSDLLWDRWALSGT